MGGRAAVGGRVGSDEPPKLAFNQLLEHGTRANDIASFENELAAQTGKSISAGDAAILDYLLSFL